jgi:DNA-binding CsgD family transcriptional regulator
MRNRRLISSRRQLTYVIDGLSTRQIAAENFTSKEVIRTQLLRFGIPLRAPHKTGDRNASVRFGSRRRKGKLIENMVEFRVVKAIVDMDAQGLSLRQIAKFLGQVGVKTKQQGKGWHPETIRRILVRHHGKQGPCPSKGAIDLRR